jgi:hypothetical protein
MNQSVAMATQDLAYHGNGTTFFITGVVFDDLVTPDQFYTFGEGVGGVQVQAKHLSNGQTYTSTTYASGGYQIEVPNGLYEVSFVGSSGVKYTRNAVS